MRCGYGQHRLSVLQLLNRHGRFGEVTADSGLRLFDRQLCSSANRADCRAPNCTLGDRRMWIGRNSSIGVGGRAA